MLDWNYIPTWYYLSVKIIKFSIQKRWLSLLLFLHLPKNIDEEINKWTDFDGFEITCFLNVRVDAIQICKQKYNM